MKADRVRSTKRLDANKPVHLHAVLFRHGEIIHFLPLEDQKKNRAQHFGSIYRHIYGFHDDLRSHFYWEIIKRRADTQ